MAATRRRPASAGTRGRSRSRCGCSPKSRGRADEQPRRADAAARGVVAEELVRQPQRGRVSARRADADGRGDAALTEARGAGLRLGGTGRTQGGPAGTSAIDERVNGYPRPSRWRGVGRPHVGRHRRDAGRNSSNLGRGRRAILLSGREPPRGRGSRDKITGLFEDRSI